MSMGLCIIKKEPVGRVTEVRYFYKKQQKLRLPTVFLPAMFSSSVNREPVNSLKGAGVPSPFHFSQ